MLHFQRGLVVEQFGNYLSIDNKHAIDQKEKLVAIVIEYRKETNVLVATNIHRIIFSIASYYPDTRNAICNRFAIKAIKSV
jgi:hypothetical protein